MGGKHTRLVNVRVLAATNRNLENAIRQNAFREDLYYRLNVFTLNVPPLRERSSDIALLINHFLDHFVASSTRLPAVHGSGYGCASRLPVARQYP